MGTLGSFVVTISVAAVTIPRDVAFQVFLGTISGGVNPEFISGIDSALYVSWALLAVQASYLISGEERQREIQAQPCLRLKPKRTSFEASKLWLYLAG